MKYSSGCKLNAPTEYTISPKNLNFCRGFSGALSTIILKIIYRIQLFSVHLKKQILQKFIKALYINLWFIFVLFVKLFLF